VQENHPCGSKNNQVTVVFDGKADIDFPLTNIPKFLEIIFTKEESAEARIKRIVEKSHNPKRIIVVSDDKEIQFFIRAEGAKVLKSEDFLARGSLKVSSVLKEEDTKIELNSSQAAKITKELERIWLK
jgi:predicted RNA-binding protein with PIN domain